MLLAVSFMNVTGCASEVRYSYDLDIDLALLELCDG